MTPPPRRAEWYKNMVSFNAMQLGTILEQILKSPETTKQHNLADEDVRRILHDDLGNIAERVAEKEMELYCKKYDVKKEEDFLELTERLSEKEMNSVRSESLKLVLEGENGTQ